ncbi:AAA family ATPase [Sphingomonas edaphi]|uniref:RecF/RecN/SMC N-terminal domain-containing protein n=1 Tax=Sphingomonas edaphi TaxID=2315689 RepID=A0A418Q264_9SPHN|nr:AAA family ATPase [Sphingomonas edaphi]RIX31947.1 hypothetical protein D3M59_02840 [Sphingomonas edaphi]
MRPNIKRVEVQGFRSFGSGRQSVDLSDTVSAFWGGNSQGKTSLAEAFEFLLTGQIIRRDMQGSSKDEFSDALRNAHLASTALVQVAADIACADGITRKLTRTLVGDYNKSTTACTSKLEIDGKPAAEPDLQSVLGIKLSQRPLQAPVLAQHTLGYVFSTPPNDRATYFRAVLDTQDLEDFRQAVASLSPLLSTPELEGLRNLAAVEGITSDLPSAALIRRSETLESASTALGDTVSELLASISVTPEGPLANRANQLEQSLEVIQSKTFPLALFGRKADVAWVDLPPNAKDVIQQFETEKSAIELEARRLVGLYSAALSLPEVASQEGDADCPLCLTPHAFTEARRDALKTELQKAETYQLAEANLRSLLGSIDHALELLSTNVVAALPKLVSAGPSERRSAGFTTARLVELSGNRSLVEAWTRALLKLCRVAYALLRVVRSAKAMVQSLLDDIEKWQGAEPLSALLREARRLCAALQEEAAEYAGPTQAVYEPIKKVVDQSTITTGWSALIDCCTNPRSLVADLDTARRLEARRKDLEKALKEIDAANGKVQDEKLSDLSSQVVEWWERLRPEESTYFEGVQRRSPTARRTIDLRVALSPNEDRTEAKPRNAVAVLSQSQLHCLGLALFLARAVKEGSTFLVLDDPVLSSDDDFRPNFNSSVIEALIAQGIQVIILTQDHKSWKDIGHRWSHRGAVQLQILRSDPRIGSELRSASDTLATMLGKAQPLIRSQEPDQRKEGAMMLRQAIERFSKELIVRDRVSRGDSNASITDYDGKDFGTYSAQAHSLLSKDPADPGKLTAAYANVTSGPHDDVPPSLAQLVHASGDIRKLKKDYLP